jgi:uncharacterized protein (DUF2236 family)
MVGDVVTSVRSQPPVSGFSQLELESVGLYGPGSEAWRINREAMLLLGAGPRSLLMQVAHPLIAEGVDQHSDFREDPWRRLQGTIRSYLRVVYGTKTQAQAEISRLNSLHRSIRGTVRDPVALATSRSGRYSARDPELSLWVHATLVDSTIVAYDAWIEPLTRGQRAAYYSETRPIGRAFGISDALLPADFEAFEAYMDQMLAPDGPVHVTPTARELARYVLRPSLGPIFRPLGILPAPLYDWTTWPGIGLLPDHMRAEFGLPWTPVHRAVATWLLAGWQFWRPLLPVGFRTFGQAMKAEARAGSAPPTTAPSADANGRSGRRRAARSLPSP